MLSLSTTDLIFLAVGARERVANGGADARGSTGYGIDGAGLR